MTLSEWMALIDGAHVAVGEQAFLWEVPLGSTEYENGHEVRYGPWDPAVCSAVLTTWFDLGWVGVYMPTEQLEVWAEQPASWMSRLTNKEDHPTLEKLAARDLIANPSLWARDRADGWAALYMTKSSPVADLKAWVRAIPLPAD